MKRIFNLFKNSLPSSFGRKWVNRANRIYLSPLHGANFRYKGLNLTLNNISATGLAIVPHPEFQIELNETFEGILVLGQVEIALTLRMAHVFERNLGCSIDTAPDNFIPLLVDYLGLELNTARLTEINPNNLENRPVGISRYWFSPETNMELFLVENPPGHVSEFYLSFLSNYIECSRSKKAVFGVLDETSDYDNPLKRKSFHLISVENERKSGFLQLCARFLANIPGLPQPFRHDILNIIKES